MANYAIYQFCKKVFVSWKPIGLRTFFRDKFLGKNLFFINFPQDANAFIADVCLT